MSYTLIFMQMTPLESLRNIYDRSVFRPHTDEEINHWSPVLRAKEEDIVGFALQIRRHIDAIFSRYITNRGANEKEK